MRGLNGGVQVDERVLLLPDSPRGVSTNNLLQDAIEGDAGLQAPADRDEGRRRPVLQSPLQPGDRRLRVQSTPFADSHVCWIFVRLPQGAVELPCHVHELL